MMLYEIKRTFGGAPIDLTGAEFVLDTPVYAGADGVSATAETAGTLDYEASNQHFPDENTLEIWGNTDAASALNGASLEVKLESSEDGVTWRTELILGLDEADIKAHSLIYRSTIPAHAGRHMRGVLTVGGEVFTAGEILMLVRPL
jgi:hypothetical protein